MSGSAGFCCTACCNADCACAGEGTWEVRGTAAPSNAPTTRVRSARCAVASGDRIEPLTPGPCPGATRHRVLTFCPPLPGPHPLAPSPRCGEGELRTALSFPLSAWRRGGQGVRPQGRGDQRGEDHERGRRARAKDLAWGRPANRRVPPP